MKNAIVRLVTVTILFINLTFYSAFANAGNGGPQRVPVSDGNTTTFIFHAAIRAVDRGCNDLLAQKMNDTILKVKAAIKDMAPTSLNVVTNDGRLHFFTIYYDSATTGQPVDIPAYSLTTTATAGTDTKPTEMDIANLSAAVADMKPFLRGPITGVERVHFRLSGLYFDSGVLYVQLMLANRSALPYKADFIRTAIMDRKTRKRSTRQETELTPVFTLLPDAALPPFAFQTMVLAFPQFSITKKKKVELQLFEASGGRHLKLVLKSRHLLRFRPAGGVTTTR